LPDKSGPEHVDWERFQANRPPRPYDPRRFFHWQCYEEYSTGIFGILMSHPLDAANLLMDLDIPQFCCATGGIYKYDDGRTVPDTCNALFNYPERKLIVSFVSSSNNAFFDQEAHYRGTQGVMELGVYGLRLYAEGDNELLQKYAPREEVRNLGDLRRTPVYEERAAPGSSTVAHLNGFFQSIRGEAECKATIEDCFRAMAAVAMAIQSYKSGRSVQWDREEERMAL
jgi:predicted dehydrogenase